MFLQVVDDEGVPVEIGKEGNLGVRFRPHRPVGLFTGYVVSVTLYMGVSVCGSAFLLLLRLSG